MKQLKVIALVILSALLQNTLTAQEDKAGKIVTEYYALLDAGNPEAIVSLLADDFTATAPFSPAPFDKKGWLEVGQAFKAAFPDMKHNIVDWFAKGNKIAVSAVFSGTNTGNMMGNPPTGNKAVLPFATLIGLDGNGRIKSMSIQFDNKAFEAQLMAGLPTPQEALRQSAVRIMKDLDNRNLDGVVAACEPGTMFHGWSPEAVDIKAYKQIMSGLLASFPDSRFVVDDVIAEGTKVVLRHHLEGTHTGPAFQGVPTSNRKIYVVATATFDFKDGKVREAWLNADFFGCLVQLGAIPSPQGK